MRVSGKYNSGNGDAWDKNFSFEMVLGNFSYEYRQKRDFCPWPVQEDRSKLLGSMDDASKDTKGDEKSG